MPRPVAPDDKFRLAQKLASEVAPMWAPIIEQWEPKAELGSRKLVVNGRTIKFDAMMPVEQLAAEIIHATDHFVMGHKHRREDRDKKKWQTSACMETVKRWDEAIKKAGLEWAPGTDIRGEHPDLSRDEAENVYDKLRQVDGQPDGSGDAEEGDLGDETQEAPPDQQGQPGQGQPQQGKPGQGQPQPGQPGQGQGQPQPGDPQGQPQPGQGQGQPVTDPDQAALPQDGQGEEGFCRLEENNYDESMMDALGDGKEPGEGDEGPESDDASAPGKKTSDKDLQRDQEEAFATLARKIIARLFAGADKRDYSLSKPSNRSSLTNGAILSSLHQKPEEVRIIIDVSGSVDDKMRNAIFRMCEKIQRQVGGNNRILVCLGDTEVKDIGPMRRVLNNAKGGGGTDMEVVINDGVRRMRGGTRWLIITDGETPRWPAKLPSNTLVLIVNDRSPEVYGTKMPPHIKAASMQVSKKALLQGGQLRQADRDLGL